MTNPFRNPCLAGDVVVRTSTKVDHQMAEAYCVVGRDAIVLLLAGRGLSICVARNILETSSGKTGNETDAAGLFDRLFKIFDSYSVQSTLSYSYDMYMDGSVV